MRAHRRFQRVYHHDYVAKRRGSYSSGTSTEYKRRRSTMPSSDDIGHISQMSSKRTDRRLDDEYAEGNLLIGNFVIVVLAVDVLLAYIRYVSHTNVVPKMLQNMTFSFETSRKTQQILTDQLDCSLLIKEALLQKYNIPMQMLFGMTCMALLVPYSVTSYSSISTMMYYLQKREALAESFRLGYITEECAASVHPPSCHIRSQYRYMQGYVDLVSGLKNSSLVNAWKSSAIDKEEALKWLYRSYSNLTAPGNAIVDKELLLRKFRRPKTIENVMLFYNVTSQYVDIIMPNITVSEDVAKKLVDDILPMKSSASSITTTAQNTYRYCEIPLLPYTNEQRLEVRFPCRDDQPTSSIISSFIVRVVREIMVRRRFERGYEDVNFNAVLLQAYYYAEYFIAKHKGTMFDPETKLPTMLLERSISLAVKSILKYEKYSSTFVRQVYERVATGIIWRWSEHETILMINLGMKHTNNTFTKLLSSGAGIMVIDKNAENAPIIAASASGSVRTVEAVASVVLRMLMFDEEPGAAIHANASFYDPEDMGFYCENNEEKFLDEFKKYGISCSPLKQDKYAHTDRIAMAIRRRPPNGRLVAAVDRRTHDYNYAVGV